ncbi:DUF6777 domain-containing protein [Streptomyces sp. NPDC091266]|uniref:DUF6777 domain-containing protein n=1 Tax=Streptomyces sp. NPDC091266 TaxID=3365978 RepID=UPI00380F5857
MAVLVTVFLTRPDGTSGAGEVFLQPAASKGKDPFTRSTAEDSSAPASPSAAPVTPSGDSGGTTSVRGSAPGLYGGSRSVPSCDVGKQIGFLRGAPAKATAFAGVEGIEPGAVPSYLRSLTAVQLRWDTRVTNHGFAHGRATGYQAVLQAGTAVLVDSHGVPRVRCACGNPLLPPVAVKGTPKTVGEPWPGYRPSHVVVVRESATVVPVFVLVDPDSGQWFTRPRGDNGSTDAPTAPPTGTPSGAPTGPPAPSTEGPAVPPTSAPTGPSAPPDRPTPGGPGTPDTPAPGPTTEAPVPDTPEQPPAT